MKVIKNINNNVSLCLDSSGIEVIAFGKGIGFIKPPQEVSLSQIDRTFYSFDGTDLEMIKQIPSGVMNSAIQIVDGVQKHLNIVLMPSTTLSLADHINFAIEREKKGIQFNMPLKEDITQMFPIEMEEACQSLLIIEKETGIRLPDNEAGNLALYFVNNRIPNPESEETFREEILQESVLIIEKEFKIQIDQNTFNYSRFKTHLNYLLGRIIKNKQIESENMSLFESLKASYPKTYTCAYKISELIYQKLQFYLSDEEILCFT